jgi:hypothetical protein
MAGAAEAVETECRIAEVDLASEFSDQEQVCEAYPKYRADKSDRPCGDHVCGLEQRVIGKIQILFEPERLSNILGHGGAGN